MIKYEEPKGEREREAETLADGTQTSSANEFSSNQLTGDPQSADSVAVENQSVEANL